MFFCFLKKTLGKKQCFLEKHWENPWFSHVLARNMVVLKGFLGAACESLDLFFESLRVTKWLKQVPSQEVVGLLGNGSFFLLTLFFGGGGCKVGSEETLESTTMCFCCPRKPCNTGASTKEKHWNFVFFLVHWDLFVDWSLSNLFLTQRLLSPRRNYRGLLPSQTRME